MAQQINLCIPILLKEKRYLSANTMLLSLGVFVVVGAALCGYLVWSLQRATASLQQTVAAQTREIENLQAALQRSRASAAPPDPALMAQLQELRNTLVHRQRLRAALQEGLLRPGWGHSDRMTWVARSIPAPAWITGMRLNDNRFEVHGFTLEPSALNDWVNQLAISPLMQGLRLANVKVENANNASNAANAAAVAATAPPSAPASGAASGVVRPVWSFHLVSEEPVAPGAPASAASARSTP